MDEIIGAILQKDTQQELQRSRALLGTRDDGYRKAQVISIRTESAGPAVGVELLRHRKELEKRRKNEEEALNKVLLILFISNSI